MYIIYIDILVIYILYMYNIYYYEREDYYAGSV